MMIGVGVNGVPDSNRKGCFDCSHCHVANSWWCVNKDAIRARRTRIPNTTNCPHWEPITMKEELDVMSIILGNYAEVDLSLNKKEAISNGNCSA